MILDNNTLFYDGVLQQAWRIEDESTVEGSSYLVSEEGRRGYPWHYENEHNGLRS
jgi:hypothetical protein